MIKLPRTADLSASTHGRRRRSIPSQVVAGLFFPFPFIAQAQDLGAGGIAAEALHTLFGILLIVGLLALTIVLAVVVFSWRRPPKPPHADERFRAYTRRSLR